MSRKSKVMPNILKVPSAYLLFTKVVDYTELI